VCVCMCVRTDWAAVGTGGEAVRPSGVAAYVPGVSAAFPRPRGPLSANPGNRRAGQGPLLPLGTRRRQYGWLFVAHSL